MLDLGAGIGRVTLDLAAAGHSVTAVDISPALLEELAARAGALPVRTVAGDIRELALDERDFDLCLVPMQTIQLLRGAAERRAAFAGRGGACPARRAARVRDRDRGGRRSTPSAATSGPRRTGWRVASTSTSRGR